MPQARRKNEQGEQAKPAPARALQAAADHEAKIAAEAAKIRGDATELAPALFLALYPLLREPIHAGHIETIGVVTGKPYDSTGIRSVQVQHDRMNSVLTPLWWREVVEYHEGGKLCHVTVLVGGDPLPTTAFAPLMQRSSYGGVDRGSTIGNVYKGSYTNAAKVAFARIGPGHEIYIGAVDLDPDVSAQAAAAQAKPEPLPDVDRIDAETFGALRDHFDACVPDKELDPDLFDGFMHDFKVELGVMGVAGVSSVNAALAQLTPAQARHLDEWLTTTKGTAE